MGYRQQRDGNASPRWESAITTIAYRPPFLAADTMLTINTHRDGDVVKIAKRGPVLACVTGSWPIALKFLDWFRDGMPPDRAPFMGTADKDNAVGNLFLPCGLILGFSDIGWTRRRAPFYATGSGADYCYGAMAMGASAEEAVRAALQFETASGGEITVLRH